jgi:siroheme synthase-like protein
MTEQNFQNNQLFPIFFKAEELQILVIGGDQVAFEIVKHLLFNSPDALVRIVGTSIHQDIKNLVWVYPNIELREKEFEPKDLDNIKLVISTLNDVDRCKEIRKIVCSKGILFNATHKPELCDFHFGSIVSKGQLKIGISINGNSPDMVKRIQKILGDSFPDKNDEVLENLYTISEKPQGELEDQTKIPDKNTKPSNLKLSNEELIRKRAKKASKYSLIVILSMIAGHILFSLLPYGDIRSILLEIKANLDADFGKYVLFGFIAQMIDGSLGMAYGVSVTTMLLGSGIPGITPAVASASMHASEIFTSGSSSLVYMRFKNINMKLFRALVWPGVLGTIVGVITVSFVSKEYFSVIKPIVAVYTFTLGLIIIIRALKKPRKRKKIKKIYPIAFSGGLLDSVGGGGWGPIVTTSLLAGGRHLRYAVGSAHLAKFFVAVVSTVSFFLIIGLSHWQIIFGLIIGGMIAAPGSIYLSNKIPIKKGLILVGMLIIIISLKTLINSFI